MPMQLRQKTGWHAPRVLHLHEVVREIISSYCDPHDGETDDLRHRCEALEALLVAVLNGLAQTNPQVVLGILNHAAYSWEIVGGPPQQP